VNGNAENAQWQRKQPNKRINYQREQCYGPAQNKQNAPQEKSSHGNLVGEPSTGIGLLTAKLRRSHTATT